MPDKEKQPQTTINFKQAIPTIILAGVVSKLVFMAGTDLCKWVQVRDVRREGESQLPTKQLVNIEEVQRFKDRFERVRKSTKPDNNFLCIICGAKGAGKTAVATLLARELIKEGRSITWLSCQAIATEVLGQRDLDDRTLNKFWDEAPAYSDAERDILRSSEAAMSFAETLYDAMSGHEGAFQRDRASTPWGTDEQKIMRLLQQKHAEISLNGKAVVIDGLDQFAENEHLQRILGVAFTTSETGLLPAIVTTTSLDLFGGMKNYYFGYEPLSVSEDSYKAIAKSLDLSVTEAELVYAIAGNNLSFLRKVADTYISRDRKERIEIVAIKALNSREASQWISGELGQLQDSETRRVIFYLSVARLLLPSERFKDTDEMKTYLSLAGIRDQYLRILDLTNRGFMSNPTSASTREREVSFLYAQLIVGHAQKPEGFGREQLGGIYEEMLKVHKSTDIDIESAETQLEVAQEYQYDSPDTISEAEMKLRDAILRRQSIDYNYRVLCKALGMTAPALKSFNVPQLTSGE